MSFGPRPSALISALPSAADVDVADVAPDSISDVKFSPTADYLAASSWNGEVRIYEVASNGNTRPMASYRHDAPALSLTWTRDGSKVISGGADNVARIFDTATGTATPVATHNAPVKSVRMVETPNGPILATGSWDQTVKYWDLRQQNQVAQLQLKGRCYSMDAVYPLLVVGTSELNIEVVNLTNPSKPFLSVISPLKLQTRVVTCFPKGDGYAVGSIEGRAGIQWIDEKRRSSNYTFRCHRVEDTKTSHSVYAVNDIAFHPVHGTFLTSGSDGSMSVWDRDAKIRVKAFNELGGPIAATSFNRDGSILAYAISYDWSKGYGAMKPDYINKIKLHAVKEDEVKPRPRR
ncbi:polyA+ RNA export [Auriculariales sp. MPI-PUGE-AT-0066]|nr:polyA+ RNA export [Auriculariales sp. MPI-PUGE-AT-0066]